MLGKRVVYVLGLLGALACQREQVASHAALAVQVQSLVANGNFSTGDLSVWNPNSYYNQTNAGGGTYLGGLSVAPGPSRPLTRVVHANPNQLVPYGLSAAVTTRLSQVGGTVAVINEGGDAHNVNTLEQTFTLGPDDIDPFDGTVHLRLLNSLVLQDGGHAAYAQPFYAINVSRAGDFSPISHYVEAGTGERAWQNEGNVFYTG